MVSRLNILTALCVAGGSPSVSVPQTVVSAEDLMQRVESEGAREVVRALYDRESDWSAVLRAIAGGDEQWMRVAVALRPGADAGASEMLTFAVGESLEHSPEPALRLAGPLFGLAAICGAVDIDDPRYASLEKSSEAVDRRQQRVASVSEAALANDRDRCIAFLEGSKDALVRFFKSE